MSSDKPGQDVAGKNKDDLVNVETVGGFNYNTAVINTSDSNEWRRSQLLLLFSTHGIVKDPTKLDWRGEKNGTFSREDITRFVGLFISRGITNITSLIQRHDEFEKHQRAIVGDSVDGSAIDRGDERAEAKPPWEEDIYRIIWLFHRDGMSGISRINQLFEDRIGIGGGLLGPDDVIPAMSKERMNEVLAEAQRRMEADIAAGCDPPQDDSSNRGPYTFRECNEPLEGHQCPVTAKYRQVIRHRRPPRKKRKVKSKQPREESQVTQGKAEIESIIDNALSSALLPADEEHDELVASPLVATTQAKDTSTLDTFSYLHPHNEGSILDSTTHVPLPDLPRLRNPDEDDELSSFLREFQDPSKDHESSPEANVHYEKSEDIASTTLQQESALEPSQETETSMSVDSRLARDEPVFDETDEDDIVAV